MSVSCQSIAHQEVAQAFTSILTKSTNSPLMMMPLGGFMQRLRLRRSFALVDKIIDEAITRGMQVRSCNIIVLVIRLHVASSPFISHPSAVSMSHARPIRTSLPRGHRRVICSMC
jgi:hypothetical protein